MPGSGLPTGTNRSHPGMKNSEETRGSGPVIESDLRPSPRCCPIPLQRAELHLWPGPRRSEQLDCRRIDVTYELSGGFGERNRDGSRGRAQRWLAGPQVPSGKPETSPRSPLLLKSSLNLPPPCFLPFSGSQFRTKIMRRDTLEIRRGSS